MKARKEITIAIIIGLLVGLVVVGGIIRARSALSGITPPDISIGRAKPTSSPTSGQDSHFLDLTTPDNQVVYTDSLILEGLTLPNTYIVILGEKSEYIIVPNDIGGFSQEVSLVNGANTIQVTSYQDDGNKEVKTLSIIYTTAEI